ncbi:MAG: PID-CTERM protein-sorting domain-containing protein [Janthinobacterium lividum]
MKKSIIVRVAGIAALGIVLSTAVALAQPGSGGPTPSGGATTVPIDGGASLLLASGVAISLKKLRDRKKQRASRPR